MQGAAVRTQSMLYARARGSALWAFTEAGYDVEIRSPLGGASGGSRVTARRRSPAKNASGPPAAPNSAARIGRIMTGRIL